jgi:DNA-binding transcriptional LysR family regulator
LGAIVISPMNLANQTPTHVGARLFVSKHEALNLTHCQMAKRAALARASTNGLNHFQSVKFVRVQRHQFGWLHLDAVLHGAGVGLFFVDQVMSYVVTGKLSLALDDWLPKRSGFHLYYPS